MSDQFQSEGPPGISKDDIEYEKSNPNLAHAVQRGEGRTLAEKMDAVEEGSGTYPDIVEGSDSERTGTSWGIEPEEFVQSTRAGGSNKDKSTEAEGATPNRNTAVEPERDVLREKGSWSTIDTDDTGGSPTGSS